MKNDYIQLRNELLKPQYAGMSDMEASRELNKLSLTDTRSAVYNDVALLARLGVTDTEAALDAFETVSTTRTAFKVVWARLKGNGLDFGSGETLKMIDALTPAVFTPALNARLKTLGQYKYSIGKMIGWEVRITEHDVAKARSL